MKNIEYGINKILAPEAGNGASLEINFTFGPLYIQKRRDGVRFFGCRRKTKKAEHFFYFGLGPSVELIKAGIVICLKNRFPTAEAELNKMIVSRVKTKDKNFTLYSAAPAPEPAPELKPIDIWDNA